MSGFAQGGTAIKDGGNLKIRGVSPSGVAAQGQVIYRAAQWQFLGQALISNPTGSLATTSVTIDTTGADLLVAVGMFYNAAFSVSDSLGNTWTLGANAGSAVWSRSYLAYCAYPTTGTAHTITFSPAAYSAGGVMTFKGPSSISADQVSTATASNSATMQLPSRTPSQSDSLVIAAVTGNQAGGQISSIDSGFNVVNQIDGTASMVAAAFAYLVQSGAAPLAPTWTFNMLFGNAAASMLSFKPS